jgi:hypothetical protein
VVKSPVIQQPLTNFGAVFQSCIDKTHATVTRPASLAEQQSYEDWINTTCYSQARPTLAGNGRRMATLPPVSELRLPTLSRDWHLGSIVGLDDKSTQRAGKLLG